MTSGGSAAAFDMATGTGTIYRYYSGSEPGFIESLYIGDSVEGHMNDTSYGISTDPSSFQSNFYLKHEVSNWEITASYACFIANNTEHCMQGGDSSYYSDNVGVLTGVQSWFQTNNGSCIIDANDSSSYCNGAGFGYVRANSDGDVRANAAHVTCYVAVDWDGSTGSDCGR